MQQAYLQFFRIWLSIGLQSFGGGAATLTLIRRAAVETYGWISESDFTRAWSLVQLAPGINLLALTILVGRKAHGAAGSLLALAGLLVPSASVTVAITAMYTRIANSPYVTSSLHLVIPATVGLGLYTASQIVRPIWKQNIKQSPGTAYANGLLLVACAAAACVWRGSVILILGLGALAGAGIGWLSAGSRPSGEPG